jgi:hypothetical protein
MSASTHRRFSLERSDRAWKTDVEPHFYLGDRALAFEFFVPHGKGQHKVALTIKPADLVKLGEVFAGLPEDDHGHAFWHFNSNEPHPCDTCSPAMRAHLESK